MDTEYRTLALAISHPTRIAILDALASGGRASPEAFAERRRLGAAAVRYHFKVLEGVGAIEEAGGEFRITERGEMLRGLAQSSDFGPDQKRPRRRD